MTSKLKVKFIRYKNMVLVDVLEQDESLRSSGVIESKGRYKIESFMHPALSIDGTCLYLRGTKESMDNCIGYKDYVDEESAKEAIKNFTELINEINTKSEEDKAGEGFEVTIAG